MYQKILLLFSLSLFTLSAWAQATLIKHLKAGKPQVLVVYGTSLSAGEGGKAWVDAVASALNLQYGNRLTSYNSGKSAMWSTWGLRNLEDSVIAKKPDAVMIEFGINDAFKAYHTSPELARLNLEYMISRIKIYNPQCEVILQVMNMPIGVHADQRPELNRYYAVYRDVASKYQLRLIDHYPGWEKILKQGEAAFLKEVPDGIHPSVASARTIIAPYILKRLAQDK